jgi:hypothetical protein
VLRFEPMAALIQAKQQQPQEIAEALVFFTLLATPGTLQRVRRLLYVFTIFNKNKSRL